MTKLKHLRPRAAGFFSLKPLREKAALLKLAGDAFRRRGWTVFAVPALRSALGREASYLPEASLARRSSLLVSLGGDGTLLGAAALAAPLQRPLLGINLGGLGFMTAFGPEGLGQSLDGLLSGSCRLEPRRLVRAEILRGGRVLASAEALNDLVIARRGAGRMRRMLASVDGRFLAGFRADGLVFSSPTGSTAYNLSVGGPLADASADVVLLSLISPHALSHRPLVLQGDRSLELELPEAGLMLAADGRPGPALKAGDRVRLKRSPRIVPLVFLPGHDAWSVLRDKLGWQGAAASLGQRRA